MLSKSVFNRIKAAFGAGVPSDQRPAFTSSKPEDQVAVVTELLAKPETKDITPEQIKGFVLLFNIKVGGLSANVAGIQKMRDELLGPPKSWPKANPPRVYFDLTNPSRSPSWAEEYQRVGEISDTLDFASVQSDDDVINAIKNVFGFGGMEDALDPRAVGAADPTMKLFVEAVKYQFTMSRPEWLDPTTGLLFKALPAEVDGRSREEIRLEAEAKSLVEKIDRRRKQQEKRREELLAAYQARKDTFTKNFATAFDSSVAAKSHLVQLLALPFEKLREVLTTATEKQVSWLDEPTHTLALSLVPERKSTGTTPEQLEDERSEAAAEQQEAINLAEQFFLTKISAAQPTWFRVLADGDLSIRKAPLKEKPVTMTRGERASYNGIGRLVDKYGPATVAQQMLAVFGIIKPVTEVFGALPEKIEVKPISEEPEKEPEELNATNVATAK